MIPLATCPYDETPLRRDVGGRVTCPTCHLRYVVSVTIERPPWRINPAAPFAQLVIDADEALYGKRRAA